MMIRERDLEGVVNFDQSENAPEAAGRAAERWRPSATGGKTLSFVC